MVSASRLTVLPNGVDVNEWRPDPEVRESMRREHGFGLEYLWFAAGRMDAVKDYSTLLRAMIQIPQPARLVIAGAGMLDSDVRRLSRDLGLEARVRFLGFEPDVCRWMQASDGFVLSSLWEGLPMALLEACACALAPVATDIPGNREIIVDGHTGFLAPAGNASALTATMIKMMCLAPEERRVIGLHARQRIVDYFSLDAALNRWEELYGALLEEHLRSARCARTH
jgi:glycosyltransferase involved in cell wall biosynthesis